VEIAIDAEFQGALGVVLNQPTKNELVARIANVLEIPIIVTVVSADEDIEARIAAGSIFSMFRELPTRRRS
jgi:hypothetical protein